MVDQISLATNQTETPLNDGSVEVIAQIMPGIIEDTKVTREMQKQNILETFSAFIDILLIDLGTERFINIIYPMDGSFIPKHELDKLLPTRLSEEQLSKINIIYSAKTRVPTGVKSYLLHPKKVDADLKSYIVDDILDHGESSGIIKEAGSFQDGKFFIIALTTKDGRGFTQGSVPWYIFEDKWVASGWGMNSGLFSAEEIRDLELSNQLEGHLVAPLTQIHNQIEIFERICAKSFLVDDKETVLKWRTDVTACMDYLTVLMQNCLYQGEELIYIMDIFTRMQGRTATEKFNVLIKNFPKPRKVKNEEA